MPDHVPADADKVDPTAALPAIVGPDWSAGAVAGEAVTGSARTTPLCAELDGVLEPPAFDAVSVTRIV
ncbi:MAG TPA: hypothetical protein VHW26_08010 [Solirubrobacteraceae bacterium]|nr:hypothetical protein [Solirubrobacteraceae bacterium]